MSRFPLVALASLTAACSTAGSPASTTIGASASGGAGPSTGTTGASSGGSSAGSTSSGASGGMTSGGAGSSSGAGTSSAGASGSSGATPARELGVFVPTFGGTFQGKGQDPILVAELSQACVDGFVVSRSWASVQPAIDGGYDWTSLDADLGSIADAGKKAAVELTAGAEPASPAWICESVQQGGAGAVCLTLVSATNPANTPKTPCGPTLLPLPWDPAYQAAFGRAIAALGAHLAGNPTVVELKMTGINYGTDETLMPYATGGDIGCNSGASCQMDAGSGDGWCAQSDAVASIEDAGYTTASMESTFSTFADDFRHASTVALGSQVSDTLPDPGSGDLAEEMVDQFISGGYAPTTVQDNGLRPIRAADPGVLDALEAGVPVGYQEYLGVSGDTACKMSQGLKPGPEWDGGCGNEQVLDLTIECGLDAGASFLELYKQDVQAFPNACALAHQALLP